MTREELSRCFECTQIYLEYSGLWWMLEKRDVMLCKRCIGAKVDAQFRVLTN